MCLRGKRSCCLFYKFIWQWLRFLTSWKVYGCCIKVLWSFYNSTFLYEKLSKFYPRQWWSIVVVSSMMFFCLQSMTCLLIVFRRVVARKDNCNINLWSLLQFNNVKCDGEIYSSYTIEKFKVEQCFTKTLYIVQKKKKLNNNKKPYLFFIF